MTPTLPRHVALKVIPESIPAELKARAQWVVWRYEWNPDQKRKGTGEKGDWDKPPSNAKTGPHASTTDSETWVSFADALAAYHTGKWDGIGYVPTEYHDIAGWDLVDRRDRATGRLLQWGERIVAALETYAEASVSGEGVRLFGRGWKPGKGRKNSYESGVVEVYGRARYLTVTGHRLDGAPATVNKRPQEMAKVFSDVFLAADERKARKAAPSHKSAAKGKRLDKMKVVWSPPGRALTNDEILKVIEDGLDRKLTDLWGGSISYHDGDDSRADEALLAKLAWWIGELDEARLGCGQQLGNWDDLGYRSSSMMGAT
jgi:primase-polymerase (primpol)-like protein